MYFIRQRSLEHVDLVANHRSPFSSSFPPTLFHYRDAHLSRCAAVLCDVFSISFLQAKQMHTKNYTMPTLVWMHRLHESTRWRVVHPSTTGKGRKWRAVARERWRICVSVCEERFAVIYMLVDLSRLNSNSFANIFSR